MAFGDRPGAAASAMHFDSESRFVGRAGEAHWHAHMRRRSRSRRSKSTCPPRDDLGGAYSRLPSTVAASGNSPHRYTASISTKAAVKRTASERSADNSRSKSLVLQSMPRATIACPPITSTRAALARHRLSSCVCNDAVFAMLLRGEDRISGGQTGGLTREARCGESRRSFERARDVT